VDALETGEGLKSTIVEAYGKDGSKTVSNIIIKVE